MDPVVRNPMKECRSGAVIDEVQKHEPTVYGQKLKAELICRILFVSFVTFTIFHSLFSTPAPSTFVHEMGLNTISTSCLELKE